MFALMLLILLIGLTGYLSVKEFLGNLASEAHEAVASLALGLVIIHIIAAIGMSWIERQNLVRSMVSGKKKGHARTGNTLSAVCHWHLHIFGFALLFLPDLEWLLS